jgi:hypothetical protein
MASHVQLPLESVNKKAANPSFEMRLHNKKAAGSGARGLISFIPSGSSSGPRKYYYEYKYAYQKVYGFS